MTTGISPVSIYQQKINQINSRISSRLSAAGINTNFSEILRNVENVQTKSDKTEQTEYSASVPADTAVQDAVKNLGISSSWFGQQALSGLSGSSYESYMDSGILSSNSIYPSSGKGIFSMNSINPNAEIGKRNEYEYLIGKAAEKYGVSDILIKAIMKAESDFNPESTSGAGAAGLMQLMPATAKLMGVSDVYDPEENINGGVGYFRQQLDAFGGDVKMALAAYNCGPTKLRNLGVTNLDNASDFAKLPKETQNYVTKIINSLK